MARQEEGYRPELLDSSGFGGTEEETTRRDEREEEEFSPSLREARATFHFAEESEGDAKTKGRGRKGRPKHRRGDKTGRAAGEAKDRNRTSGRSAKELGIAWPATRCEKSPKRAHFFVGSPETVDAGYVFTCLHCGRVKWLPMSVGGAHDFGALIGRHGIENAYLRMLDKRPAAKRLIIKLQDLWHLKKIVPEDRFPYVVAAIMSDKFYTSIDGDVDIVEDRYSEEIKEMEDEDGIFDSM